MTDRDYLHAIHQLQPANLRSRLKYDATTGCLHWRKLPQGRDSKRWNSRFAGKLAGATSVYGYNVITIDDRQYKSHHVAWAIYHGYWPLSQIDHINGNRCDNRICNLRLSDAKSQARNRKKPSDNTSGYIGVSPTKHRTWVANISTDTGRKYLGRFKCVTAAAVARRKAEISEPTYHPNHGRAI